MTRLRTCLAVGAGAVVMWSVVGRFTRGALFLPIAIGVATVVVGGTVVVMHDRRTRPVAFGRSNRDLLLICWVALNVLPAHDFVKGSSSAAVKTASVSSMVELAYFTGVAAVALYVLRKETGTMTTAAPPLRMFLVPAWVITSSFWSESGPYAFVRGYQFAAIGLLGWATVAVCRRDRSAIEPLLVNTMQYLAIIIGALAASGFVFTPSRVNTAAENMDRFAWFGAGPNVVGPLLVAGVIYLLLAGPRMKLPWPIQVAIGAVLCVGLYRNQSRAALLGLAVAVVVVVVFRWTRERPRELAIAAPFVALAGYIAVIFYDDKLWEYLSRGQSSERLANGNGRRDLWRIGFESLTGPFDWIAGHGYGITRTLFQAEKQWAGTAHNSLLAVLIGLGLVGVVLFLGQYAVAIADLVRDRGWWRSPPLVALVAVVASGFFGALFNDRMAEPSDGYACLVLLLAVLTARAGAPSPPSDSAVPVPVEDVAPV